MIMSKPPTKDAETLAYIQLFRTNAFRSVMIRDLPFSSTNEDIASLCQSVISIDPEIVHILFDSKRCPLHYGYILFRSKEDAETAICKLDRYRFRGRDIRLSPFNNSATHEKGRQGAVHVFFRAQALRKHPITEETLRNFLQNYGAVEHVIVRTYGTNSAGLVEGFGFVTFSDPSIHPKICQEVKRLVFDGVAYDCTISKRDSNNAKFRSRLPLPSPNVPNVPLYQSSLALSEDSIDVKQTSFYSDNSDSIPSITPPLPHQNQTTYFASMPPPILTVPPYVLISSSESSSSSSSASTATSNINPMAKATMTNDQLSHTKSVHSPSAVTQPPAYVGVWVPQQHHLPSQPHIAPLYHMHPPFHSSMYHFPAHVSHQHQGRYQLHGLLPVFPSSHLHVAPPSPQHRIAHSSGQMVYPSPSTYSSIDSFQQPSGHHVPSSLAYSGIPANSSGFLQSMDLHQKSRGI